MTPIKQRGFVNQGSTLNPKLEPYRPPDEERALLFGRFPASPPTYECIYIYI